MFNYLLYRLGQFIAMCVPLGMAYKIAVFFSDIHYVFADKDRRTVRENLKAIFPGESERQIRRIRLRMFRNFAKYLVDFFRFSRLDKAYISRLVKIENLAYVDEALSRGKGLICLTAHLGNWELAGVVMALSGYPIWAVALPHKHKRIDKFFNFQRESKGMMVIPLGRAARECLNVLRQNKMLALAGDRDFTGKGVVVEFFGRPSILPVGPAAFSLKTQAPIVPGFMFRKPDDTFTLRFEKPFDFTPSGNSAKDIQDITFLYKTVIENYIRKYPDQWYMFRKFWVE